MAWSYSVKEIAPIVGAELPDSDAACTGVSTDTRTLQPGDIFFALQGENFDANRFLNEAFEKGASAAVVTDRSGDASGPCMLVDDTLRALQRFARHHRHRYDIPLIAITGSSGKTSSKDLIAAVLETRYTVAKTRGNLNNAIGCPLSLLRMDSETGAAVIEMGANHPGEIRELCDIAAPTEAAITLIGASHLEGFGSLEGVASAKAEIVESLPESGVFYVNADDARCAKIADAYSGVKVYYGTEVDAGNRLDVALRSCSTDPDGLMCLTIDPVGEISVPLYSRAHVVNVLLAVSVGLQHGVTEFEGPIRDACQEPARFNVTTVGGVILLDDTYNANPDSMRAALDALHDHPAPGSRIAALGDMLELGPEAARFHTELGRLAGESGVSVVFARGEHACATIAGAEEAGVAHATALDDHSEIAKAIHKIVRPGDVVLIKGSRGLAMEHVVRQLTHLLDPQSQGD